jgi:hypothetical protein
MISAQARAPLEALECLVEMLLDAERTLGYVTATRRAFLA